MGKAIKGVGRDRTGGASADETVLCGMFVHARGLDVCFAVGASEDGKSGLVAGAGPVMPFAGGKHDFAMSFSGKPNREIKQMISYAADRIKKLPGLGCISVASYGPLQSVDIADRDCVDDLDRQERYGSISERTTHEALQGIQLYRLIKERFDLVRGPEIVVTTDVTAGAVGEFFRRSNKESVDPRRRAIRPGDVLVYVHLAEGIGGAAVTNFRPFPSALHPEVGYLPVQLAPEDDWARKEWPQLDRNRSQRDVEPVFVEDVASVVALLKREASRLKPLDSLDRLSEKGWSLAGFYVSQLCAAITVMYAPHQIILDGPLATDDLMARVRRDYPKWLVRRGGHYIEYAEMTRPVRFIDRPVGTGTMLFGALCIAAERMKAIQ